MRVLQTSVVCAVLCSLAWSAGAAEIHRAAAAGDLRKVREIVATDPAAVKERTPGGSTALHVAAASNRVEVARFLLSKGSAIDAPTGKGYTPLHVAVVMGAEKTAGLLLASGARVDASSKDGLTPLRVAIRKKNSRMAGLLVTRTKAAYLERSFDLRTEEGRLAFKNGEMKTALDVMSRVLREHPADENVNYTYGQLCLGVQDLSRAELAFERIVTQVNPRNDRARRDLAMIYMATDRPDMAREELERVLANNPPPEVRASIEATLERIEGMRKRWLFSGSAEAGVFHDNNVNVGPDSDVVSISPITFGATSISELDVDEASQPASAGGGFASLSASVARDAGEPGGMMLTADVAAYRNWLADESAYESMYYQGGLGLKYIGIRDLFVLGCFASSIEYGGEPLVNIYGLVPSYTHVAGAASDWWLTTAAGLEMRDYDSLDDRDGPFALVGQTVRRVVGDRRHTLSASVAFFRADAESPVYEHSGASLGLAGEYKLPARCVLYGGLRFVSSEYKEREALAPEKRQDDQIQITAGISHAIDERWAVDLSFTRTDNNSTFDLYEYTRDIVGLSSSCEF